MEKVCVLFKILSGNHLGAETELNQGDWSIGSSEDCDFILSDIHIQAHHIILKIEENGNVFLVPQNAIIFLNGKEIQEDKVLLPHFQVVSLGSINGTHFCIGPCKGEWQEVSIPTEIIATTQNLIEQNQDMIEKSEEQNEITNSTTKEKSHIEVPSSDKSTFRENLEKTEINTKKSHILIKIALIILFLALACGGSLFTYQALSPKQETTDTVLTELLNTVFYKDVYILENKEGITLKGIVNKEEDIAMLESLLTDMQNKPSLQIYSSEHLEQELQSLFQQYDTTLQASRVLVNPKEIRIKGYVYNQDTFLNLIEPLQEIMQLFSIKLSLTYGETLEPELISLLKKNNLTSQVSYILAPFYIGIQSNNINSEEEKKLNALILELEDSIQGKSPFIFTQEKNNLLDLNLTSQKIMDKPSLPRVKNPCIGLTIQSEKGKLSVQFENTSYKQGAKLPTDWLIKDVTVNMIVLVDNNNHMQICRK